MSYYDDAYDDCGADYGYDCCYDHVYDYPGYEAGPNYSSGERHDYSYADEPTPSYAQHEENDSGEGRNDDSVITDYGSYGRGTLTAQRADAFEEYHVVQGNSTRNGPYTHENHRIHHEDGSYHGQYLWEANKPQHGHHVHQGSYGMERNSTQDIHYDYESEYNLNQPLKPRDTYRDEYYTSPTDPSRSHYAQREPQYATSPPHAAAYYEAFDNNGRMHRHDGGPEYRPAEKDWLEDNWRSEYHFVRKNGMTVYTEESHTDGKALARAWMERERKRDGGRRRRPSIEAKKIERLNLDTGADAMNVLQ